MDDVMKEKYEVMNQMYALIMPVLSQYETRGYNAHQRAQSLTLEAVDKMEDWVRRQVGESVASADEKKKDEHFWFVSYAFESAKRTGHGWFAFGVDVNFFPIKAAVGFIKEQKPEFEKVVPISWHKLTHEQFLEAQLNTSVQPIARG